MVSVPATEEACLRCKGGRLLCGLYYCPLIIKSKALIPVRKVLPTLKEKYFGPSPPSLFIGRFGYPKVRIGPMGAINSDYIEIIDEPDIWGTKRTMEEIVGFRARLFRFMGTPHKVTEVTSRNTNSSKIVEITQEQVQSSSPVDLEIKFNKKPLLDLKFDRFTQPMGPRISVESVQLASTPKIDQKIDYVVSDTDLSAIGAVNQLYKNEATVTQIARIFSAGLLGYSKNRRFVPTRWSITATDSLISKYLRNKIVDFSPIQNYLLFRNKYLDNDFWVLFLPRDFWSFDYHETWKRKSAWNLIGTPPRILSDTEGPTGRTTYASNTVGGYYAARLAVLEKLVQLSRKASVIVFREVGKGYAIPLGVWQVRENMRTALSAPPRSFDDLDQALKYIDRKLTIPIRFYFQKSPLLHRKTLDEFF